MCPGDPPVPQVFHDLGRLARVVELATELAEGHAVGVGHVIVLPPKVGEVLRLVGEQAREVDGQLLRLGEVEDVDDGVRRGYGCIGFDVISCGKYH